MISTIQMKHYSVLLRLVLWKDKDSDSTFNLWSEGEKKILCILSEDVKPIFFLKYFVKIWIPNFQCINLLDTRIIV